MRWRLGLGLAMVLPLLLVSPRAAAGSCLPYYTEEGLLQKSPIAFRGRVIAIFPTGDPHRYTAVFAVQEMFKGTPTERIALEYWYFDQPSDPCPKYPIERGKVYHIYTRDFRLESGSVTMIALPVEQRRQWSIGELGAVSLVAALTWGPVALLGALGVLLHGVVVRRRLARPPLALPLNAPTWELYRL